ncbi:type I-E CRISPR-associated protein Cas6/Cse3/CasE [Saccharothrix algeriensis]|uniref:CRISPR system Cascade subunit CasE n=1 Tax=Saccharothrix algeriensis TaxID=173560 RepID=A0A8T8HWF3_9PSEU|nr:type I-E CRISPR-associated protein Cas6/Cse3/CasE [Saccharothrix algeriensis]MBM7814399.1 CRISPR system Cascade subunit CasE [Saccharothrix algeriensis]QTR02711.1 type I-E CRISPR-associated protein Cas6/Cse3/CasE [Saccharothrix algeriensis]
MHLTRFEINPARRDARALLASPQKLHAAVMAAFPTTASTATAGRVLWRVDRHQHQVLLYLVSPHRPDLTHLVEQVGWPTTGTWDTRDYRPLLDHITTGQQWAFRLRANPVSNRRKSTDSTRSQRFGHVTVAQQTDWLLTRTERHGFTVPLGEHKEPDVAVRGREQVTFKRQAANVTLSTAVFEGHLEVLDADLLRAALVNGIGPAKGYGCGLLTLAPVRRA